MVRLADAYLLTGLAIGLSIALVAGFGLGRRRMLIFFAVIVLIAVLIPVAVRLSPLSIGLPLIGLSLMLGGFLCALRVIRRGMRVWPRRRVLLVTGGVAAYALAGVVLPWIFPTGARSDVFVYQQGLIVLALPMLCGAVLGQWTGGRRVT